MGRSRFQALKELGAGRFIRDLLVRAGKDKTAGRAAMDHLDGNINLLNKGILLMIAQVGPDLKHVVRIDNRGDGCENDQGGAHHQHFNHREPRHPAPPVRP